MDSMDLKICLTGPRVYKISWILEFTSFDKVDEFKFHALNEYTESHYFHMTQCIEHHTVQHSSTTLNKYYIVNLKVQLL